jgi:hypothetical protein
VNQHPSWYLDLFEWGLLVTILSLNKNFIIIIIIIIYYYYYYYYYFKIKLFINGLVLLLLDHIKTLI